MKLEEIFTLCSCKCGILSSFNKKKKKQRKLLKYVLINAKGRGHALWRSTFTLRYFSISPLDIFRNMYMKVTEPIMKRKKKTLPTWNSMYDPWSKQSAWYRVENWRFSGKWGARSCSSVLCSSYWDVTPPNGHGCTSVNLKYKCLGTVH